jgi:hypothetical protein
MSVPATRFGFDTIRRFDGPGYFLAGGFVAGLLCFLVWLGMRPDAAGGPLRARGGEAQAASALAAPGKGVLTAITGQDNRGGADVASGFFGEADAGDEAGSDDGSASEDAYAAGESDSMAIGEDVGAPVQAEEGAALTDGLLDAPRAAADAAPASAPGAPLLPYYVEIEVAPGQTQVLQLNAESAEHARIILRDFRGDPRVLRGPTTEPLE